MVLNAGLFCKISFLHFNTKINYAKLALLIQRYNKKLFFKFRGFYRKFVHLLSRLSRITTKQQASLFCSRKKFLP